MASSRRRTEPLMPEEPPSEAPPAVLTLKREVGEEEIEEIRAKMDAERPVIMVPGVPPAPKGVDEETYNQMVAILSPQKGKRAVPTLVRFRSEMANTDRFVIVDVSEALMDEAYRCWLSHGYTDDEEFLDTMYKITRLDIPRMYRTVAFYDLKSVLHGQK